MKLKMDARLAAVTTTENLAPIVAACVYNFTLKKTTLINRVGPVTIDVGTASLRMKRDA